MSRKFFAVCSLALALVLALTGCNLVKVDEAMDAASVVASFDGGQVTKGEVEPMYTYYVNYYNMLSSYYGYQISTDGLLEGVTESAVQQKIILNKAEELGLASLTEEEETELRDEAAANYEEYVQQYWDEYAEEGLTDDEIRADVDAFLSKSGYTLDSAYEDLRDQRFVEKVRDHIYEGVSVTPEEVQNRYDEKVAAAEASYADLTKFESDVSTAGTTVYWYPEGYRTVKQILISFPEDAQTGIQAIDAEIASLQEQIDTLTASIAETAQAADEPAETTDENADTTDEPAETTDENADTADDTAADVLSDENLLAQYQSDLAAKQAERETAVNDGIAAIQDTIDAVLARIENGDDFQTLIDEYNEDPGMQSEPAATTGYYVSADTEKWVIAFRDASMALENIGDVSEPVPTSYGVHIIRYDSDVPSGAVSYEDVRETVEKEVLSDKQSAEYDSTVQAWIDAANVKYDYSSFN